MIIIFGRYVSENHLYGSEKFVRRLFEYFPDTDEVVYFIDFYSNYKMRTLWSKLFGKCLIRKKNNIFFYKLGIFGLLSLSTKRNIKSLFITNLDLYAYLTVKVMTIFRQIPLYYILHGVYKYELEFDKYFKEKLFHKIKYYFLEKNILKMINFIFILSESSKKLLRSYYKISTPVFYKMRHGIDDDFFPPEREFNLQNELKIIYTGGLGRGLKGFDLLIDSLSKVRFQLQLTICGSIINHDILNKELNKLKNNIRVFVHGFLETARLAEYFKENDVFILPSKFESFSIATIEAMGSSLVPVVTKSSGISEIIEDGVNGYLFDFNDPDSLANILEQINNNRELLVKIGSKAHHSVKNLSWYEVAKQYSNILSNPMSKPDFIL